MIKYLALGVGLNLALISCNGAGFSSNPSSASNTPNRSNEAANLACIVTPGTVPVGNAANIIVSAANWVKGPVYQKVTNGEEITNSILQRSADSFTLENGTSNIVSTLKAGTYSVELRLMQSAAAPQASCSFTVTGNSADVAANNPNPADPNNPNTPYDPSNPNTPYDPSNPYNPNQPSTPYDPSVPGTGPVYPIPGGGVYPPVPVCQVGQESIGAYVGFVVDNSNSNVSTDCPNPVPTGMFNGAETFECHAMTQRQNAVMSAFQLLEGIGYGVGSGPLAASMVSVASFPTRQDYMEGYRIQTQGWVPAERASQDHVARSMNFANQPFGMTPYGAAMRAMTEMFENTPNDGRAKVAVMVTDGEPTDRDPFAVAAHADALKRAGVEVITVFINGNQPVAARKAAHTDLLARYNTWSLDSGAGPWYADTVRSFDEYLALINGSPYNSSLVEEISSQVDPTCVEMNGQRCVRRIIEINNIGGLQAALENVIRTRAIQCQ